MKHKRTCSKCKLPIAKSHKWHTVYHRFLWFTWTTVEHRDCQHPEQIHKHVVRLKGEVPLPFGGPMPIYDSSDNSETEEFTDEQIVHMLKNGMN